jgi:hypothetical protein
MDQEQYLHEVGQNLADLFYNQNKMTKEMDEFLDKLNKLCWEYHIEIKPTHPVPNDEYPTISIINGDEVVKLVYIDGDSN